MHHIKSVADLIKVEDSIKRHIRSVNRKQRSLCQEYHFKVAHSGNRRLNRCLKKRLRRSMRKSSVGEPCNG